MINCCQFCQLQMKGHSRHFSRVMNDTDLQEVIYSGDSVVLIPDVAPCTSGHMLIVARDHRRALLANWHETELTGVVETVESCLADQHGLIVFEHGIIAENAKPSCVEHAHAHLIPFSNSILPSLQDELGELVPITSPTALDLDKNATEYAVVRDIDRQWYRASVAVIPGQAIRRAVLGSRSDIHWNWLDYVEFSGPLNTRHLILKGSKIFDTVRAAFNRIDGVR